MELIKQQSFGLLDDLREKVDFLNSLWDGDDWSFVIKIQTLIEAAVTQSILTHIDDNRLQRAIEVLPLCGGEASKLEFAKNLELLTKEQRRFIKKVAALRNKLAHRVEYVAFSFDSYIESFGNGEKKDWQDSITWFAESQEQKEIWNGICLKMPKIAIHMSAFVLIALVTTDGTEKRIKRKIGVLSDETIRDLMGKGSG